MICLLLTLNGVYAKKQNTMVGKKTEMIFLDLPPTHDASDHQDASHHQDYYTFLGSGIPEKNPSFASYYRMGGVDSSGNDE